MRYHLTLKGMTIIKNKNKETQQQKQKIKNRKLQVLERLWSNWNPCAPDHRTRKGQFSIQSQRKAMPKNVQTTAQLHSSHKLAK